MGMLHGLAAAGRRLRERMTVRPGPFDCAWCRDEDRHDMCTGKAVRPHLEGAFWPGRVAAAVEACRCALTGHR